MTAVLPPPTSARTDLPPLEVLAYPVSVVARYLGCSADHVRRLIDSGELPVTNIGLKRVQRVRAVELVRYLDRNTGSTFEVAP